MIPAADQPETSYDGLNPLERPVDMDLNRVKEYRGHHICLLGNIDCQELLPHGTPDRVQAEAAVKQAIDDTGEGREGGGQIIGSSTWLHACANPENCIAMFQAPQKYSAYDNRE